MANIFIEQNLIIQIAKNEPGSGNKNFDSKQCCGTVIIFYGSGSDFLKVMVPVPTFKKVMVPVPVPTLEK